MLKAQLYRSNLKKLLRRNSLAAGANTQYEQLNKLISQKKISFDKLFEDFKQSEETEQKLNKVYVHPLDEEENPLNFCPGRNLELMYDLIGPEQVSPHYENFLHSRKWAIGMWATFFGISLGATFADFGWVMRSTMVPFIFYSVHLYFFLEGRSSMFLPFLGRFYGYVKDNEIKEIEEAGPDAGYELAKQNIEKAKEQLEYLQIHQDFQNIKFESVNRFLSNQQINLKSHIRKRARSILETAINLEGKNQTEILQNITKTALKMLKNIRLKVPNDVKKASFQSALKGIQSGKMDYDQDLILGLVMEKVKSEISKFKKFSEEE